MKLFLFLLFVQFLATTVFFFLSTLQPEEKKKIFFAKIYSPDPRKHSSNETVTRIHVIFLSHTHARSHTNWTSHCARIRGKKRDRDKQRKRSERIPESREDRSKQIPKMQKKSFSPSFPVFSSLIAD